MRRFSRFLLQRSSVFSLSTLRANTTTTTPPPDSDRLAEYSIHHKSGGGQSVEAPEPGATHAKEVRRQTFRSDFELQEGVGMNAKESSLLNMWRTVPNDPSLSDTTTTTSPSATAAGGSSYPTRDPRAETFHDTRVADPAEPTDRKRRRLIYQSQYRGMVEMDLILGHFARCKLPSLARERLEEYDILLRQLDNDLFNWFVMREEAPEALRSMACFKALQDFVEEEREELLGYY